MKVPLEATSARTAFRAALLDYYDDAARDLPWRSDSDPYRVLVSEVMLQQTRVETVKGYYGAWLERFPTIESLAEAHEDDVLKAWEGLGYYRRARYLHRAARVVREDHGGRLPERSEGLAKLPGIGEYTAGAVASIAFAEPVPAVDGNVRRVLARLFDVAEPKGAWLRATAAELVDGERPGDWNQALMELGATVCTPRNPSCGGCPVAEWCAARAADTVSERPTPPVRRRAPIVRFVLALLHADGRVLVERRPERGLLAGMWALPERRVDEGEGIDAGAAARRMAEERGLRPEGVDRALPEVRHLFTHLDARYRTVAIRVDSEAIDAADRGTERAWISFGHHRLALPVAQRKVIETWQATEVEDE